MVHANLDQLLIIQDFARTDKWDVRFSDMPSGFPDWLPCTDCNLPLYGISDYSFTAGNQMYSLPRAIDFPDISLTFLENDQRTISKWLYEWALKIFPLGSSGGVEYLSKSVKLITIEPLTLQNEIASTYAFSVYPTASVIQNYNSMSNPIAFPASFKVVGLKKRETETKNVSGVVLRNGITI